MSFAPVTRGELRVLNDAERRAIDRLWSRKLEQDKQGLPQSERHRNLEPDSAEFIHALAAGCGARSLLEIGGSSGLSTIALAAEAHGSVWLMTVERRTEEHHGGRHVAWIGPLAVPDAGGYADDEPTTEVHGFSPARSCRGSLDGGAFG